MVKSAAGIPGCPLKIDVDMESMGKISIRRTSKKLMNWIRNLSNFLNLLFLEALKTMYPAKNSQNLNGVRKKAVFGDTDKTAKQDAKVKRHKAPRAYLFFDNQLIKGTNK